MNFARGRLDALGADDERFQQPNHLSELDWPKPRQLEQTKRFVAMVKIEDEAIGDVCQPEIQFAAPTGERELDAPLWWRRLAAAKNLATDFAQLRPKRGILAASRDYLFCGLHDSLHVQGRLKIRVIPRYCHIFHFLFKLRITPKPIVGILVGSTK